jgi:TP901 family phage tail tape measure protein
LADQNIVTNITATANFSSLTAQLQAVTSQLLKLQATTIGLNKNLTSQVGVMNRQFDETMRSTGQFSRHFVTLTSDVSKFGQNLDSGRMKLGQYFRTWQGHTQKTSSLVRDLAKQQVMLENAIIQPLGKNAQGLMQYNVMVQSGLDVTKNKSALLRQELAIMNKVMMDGSNQLINWGKNTQWAGRQLTVGLTVPLAAFGMAAAKAFRQADEELVRLTKVYGGLTATSSADLLQVRKDVMALSRELASGLGANFTETIALAADIAATGKEGADLLDSTRQTTRLAILGEVDRQDAMKATLAIQTAFGQNTMELAESIDFLNAVENQTSTTLEDLVTAIPKAGPVVKALGGDVQDLALYLTAMREGGINASEGANALKSALASVINPTKVAKEMFMGFGIDLSGIVNKNAGNLTGTIMALKDSLDSLEPLQRARAIEQLFGKFQFARINALFENLGKEGSQTLQVLDLMKASTQDLASISERELKALTESASGKYRRALESVKAELAGVGEQFLKVGAFVLNAIDGILKFIGNLPAPIKAVLGFIGGLTAIAGPIIMLTGVLANFFGYIIKGVLALKNIGKGGTGFKLLTPELMAASAAAKTVEQSFYSDTKAAATFSDAVLTLAASFDRLKASAMSATVATSNGISTVGGSTVLAGGGRIVDKDNPLVGRPFSRDMSHVTPTGSKTPQQRADETIFSTVPGPKPVNLRLSNSPQTYMTEDLPRIHGVTAVNGVSNGIVASEAAKWHSMTAAIAMQSKAELAILKTEVAATGTITASLADSYQALLPQMTRITTLAADETALIVQQLQAGKITVEAARAKIFALNAQVEAMMVQTAQGVAAAQARTISLTTVPLTSQPVVSAAGKSNMKELFHKTETAKMVDAIARGLGVRTSGAGYSIHTTKPRFNTGGKVEAFGANKTRVTGPASITYDDRMGDVPLGGYVLNQAASMDPRNAPLVAAAPSTYREPGKNITALLTPQETVFGAGIQDNPELFRAVDAANNGVPLSQHAAGGKIKLSRSSYGLPALNIRPLFKNKISEYRKRVAELAEQKNKTRLDPRGRDTQIIGSYGGRTWVTRGASTNAAIDDYMRSLPPSERRKAAKVIEEFSASIETTKRAAERGAPRGRDAFAIEAGHLEANKGALAKKLDDNELPPLDLKKIIHATHLTRAVVINGKRYVSKYTVDYDAQSNLQANQGTLLAKDFLDRNMGRIGKYDRLMRKSGVPQEKWADTEKEIDQKIKAILKGKESKNIGDEKGDITFDSFIPLIDSSIVSAGGSAAKLKELQRNVVERKNSGGVVGGKVKPGKFNYGRLFLGMPRGIKAVETQRKARLEMEAIDTGLKASRFAEMPPTDFGKLISPSTGRSFPVPGIGGLYEKADGTRVFVKPVMDEAAALAEQRATIIAREAHGLNAPKQEIRTMIDPTDPSGRRKLIVLESPYDEAFAKASGTFDQKDYFKQLVAANLRGDKDLSPDNLYGSTLNDVGTAGVFKMASGKRSYHGEMTDKGWIDGMPSMKDQANINLLGVKGGARRFFAESTLAIPKGMTPKQYHEAMINEIDDVLPRLKETVAKSLGKLNAEESAVYAAMIKRLEDGRRVNWEEFHGIHSAVKVSPAKALTPAALQKLKEEAELRIRQRGHAISLSDNSFKTSLNGFNGGGIIGNILKSLAMRRIGAGFGPTGAPKPSMYESAPWGVSSLSIKAAETLFASTGLRPYSQKLLYDKFAAALAKEKPYGYVKGADGSLRNALEPSSLDAVIRKAASDLMSDRAAFKQLSPIDRDILKRKYLNWDSKKDTPITGDLKKKIFGIDGKREMGGPVSPGQSYLVGEKGPELFSPQQSGKIIPGFTLGGLIRRSKDFYGQKLTDVSQVSSKEHAKRLLKSGDPSQRAIGQLWLDNDKASRMPAPTPPRVITPGPMSVEKVTKGGTSAYVPQGSLPYVPALKLPVQAFNNAISASISSIGNNFKTASTRMVANTRILSSEIKSSLSIIADGGKKFSSGIKKSATAVSQALSKQTVIAGAPGAGTMGGGAAFFNNAKYSTASILHPIQYLKNKGIGSDPDRPLGSGAGGMLMGTMGGMAAGGAIGNALGGQNGMMMGSMVGSMAGPAIMQGAGKLVASMAAKSVSAGVASAGLGATAAGVAGLVAPLAAVTAAVYGGYKAWKHYKEGQTLNISTFGMTAEAAKKANLRFTDFGSKIKDTIQDSKDMAAANKLVYESMKDGGTPFQLTIAEYKKLKVEVKETFAEQIKALDRQPSNKVPDAVRRIKEQLIAAGMSADEATKKVFTMLQLSNKKDQSITATMGNSSFKEITDAQTAAVSAVTSFGADTRDQGNKEKAASLNTALMATETGINDLIAKRERLVAKDLTGKTKSLTYAEAEKIMIDKINKSKEAGTVITQATVDEMAKTNPEVKKMINGSDTVVSVWQKIRLQAQGFNGDLSQLNAAQTKLLADSFAAISDSVIATNRAGILKEQYASLGKLEDQIKRYTKALKGQTVAEQISDRDRLKSLNKQIEAINKLAEARKKALSEAQKDADLGREIEKVRLEIANAVAVGDTEKAQSLRIDLESLTSQQQTEAQMNAIDKATEAATKPLKDAAEAIANKQEKLGDAAQIAAESLDKLKDKYAKQEAAIKKVNDSMTALYGNAAAAGLSVKDYMKKNETAAAGFVAAMEAATGAAMPKYKEVTTTEITAAGPVTTTTKVPIAPYENALALLAKSGAATGVNEALANSIKGKEGKTLSDVVNAVKGINGKAPLRENIAVTGDYSDSKETKEYDGKKVKVLNAEARDAIRKRLDLQPGETFIVDGQRYKQNTTGGTPIWMGPAPKTPALHEGGKISGPGTKTSDSIPAMLSDGEYVFSAKAVDAAGGSDAVDSLHKALRRAEGGPVGKQKPQKQQLPFFPWRPDLPDYWSNGAPTGNPRTGRWGELRYGPSNGKDIWGGTEIPGLKFTGKTPQQSDYWHQMQEQPGKSRGPGMGIDKDPMRLAGSGASMGGIGNGAYGFGPLMFHKGGPVGHRHGRNLPEKQNWFQRYVSNLSKSHDDLPGWASDPLGSVALLRKIAGQGRKGDNLSAALMPLNFFGMGLGGKVGAASKIGLAGNLATGSTEIIKSTKASTTIMRNLHRAMLESAESSGNKVPNLTAPDTLRLSTSMLDEASDHGAALRKYWGQAYEILKKSKNPVVDGMTKDDFFKAIAGSTENATSRWSGTGFSTASGPSPSQIDNPSDFIKAANSAYLQAHGLSPSQPLSMFRAVRAPWNYKNQVEGQMMFDPSLTPEQIFSSSIAHELGGYWSLSSKMAASYLRNLGQTRSKLAEAPYGGFYKVEVPAESFPTPIGMGGMMDEYANVFNPSTIDSLRTATKIGSGWENLLTGPKRSTVLGDFYKTSPIPAKGKIDPEALEKLKSSLTDDELRLLMKLMKDSELGRSISRSSPFLSTPLAGSRWNEHQGLNHIMNLIKKAEEALGQPILVPRMSDGGMVSIPKFKDGINVVPQDMLALIHKNESIVPASMNPFNPEASMPKYNFNRSSFNVRGDGAIGASYTVNQNIYASDGMDVEALSNMIVKKAEVVIGQKAKVNVKMVGQGKNI